MGLDATLNDRAHIMRACGAVWPLFGPVLQLASRQALSLVLLRVPISRCSTFPKFSTGSAALHGADTRRILRIVFSARRRSRMAQSWVGLLTLIRVLAVVLGVQVSGTSHAVADVMNLVVARGVAHEEECPADRPCEDCPQGCPNCHCSNAISSLIPDLTPSVPTLLPIGHVAAVWEADHAPLRPELSPPFRPPRTSRSVS